MEEPLIIKRDEIIFDCASVSYRILCSGIV